MKNAYEIRGNHVAIFLSRTKGREPLVCLVDLIDFEKVAAIPGAWCPDWRKNIQNYYAVSNCFQKVDGKRCRVANSYTSMHRMVMEATGHGEVDHVDRRYTLDNRRSNLRIATRRQNALNSKRAVAKRDGDKWRINITLYGKNYNLGSYRTEEEATLVRLGAVLLADSLEADRAGTVSLVEHATQGAQ